MRSVHSWTLAFGMFALCIASSLNIMAQESKPPDSDASATQNSELPDSPGTTWARLQQSTEQTASQAQSAAEPAASGSSSPAQNQSAAPPDQSIQEETSDQTQNRKMQRPVGTAAAEAPKVSGVTAAQPAGVAIAPAKQRRVRILVLKVGAILGASAAIGTVVALSAATPSKPPGAH